MIAFKNFNFIQEKNERLIVKKNSQLTCLLLNGARFITLLKSYASDVSYESRSLTIQYQLFSDIDEISLMLLNHCSAVIN